MVNRCSQPVDWVDLFLRGGIVVLLAMLLGCFYLLIGLVHGSMESAEFMRNAKGMTYQALVLKIGVPTNREQFQDGTEVICWKTPNGVSRKAVMRNGVCITMEYL